MHLHRQTNIICSTIDGNLMEVNNSVIKKNFGFGALCTPLKASLEKPAKLYMKS